MAIARHDGNDVNSRINVTPMVDVMLVLLIIFMVITPMLRPDTPVEMAKTDNPERMPDAEKTNALIIAVAHDGTIFLGTEIVTEPALAGRVSERLAGRTDKTIYLRADARARYKFVVDAVDDVRSAGVDRLGLLTEQRQHIGAR